MPLKDDVLDAGCAGDVSGGDCMPPKNPAFDCACCCGGGCGAATGFEAYNERIDDLRSARPGTPGVPAPVLEGLAGGAD